MKYKLILKLPTITKKMNYNFEIDDSYSRKSIEIKGTLNSNDLDKIEKVISSEKIEYISFDYEQTENTWKEINRIIITHNSSIRISLSYSETELENISFLKYLPDIKELFIFYFKGVDLSPIAHLKELKILKFFNVFQSAKVRLKPLTGLDKLEELKIFHIKDIEEIENFSNLKYIGLESLKINNLNFLKPLLNLERIELRSSDKITDYSGLYDLPKLKDAFIVKNYKDTTAEFISHLKNLKKLDITDYNSVSKFPSLEKLEQLTDLSITSWKILNDISGVSKAPNLENLSLFVGKEFKTSALNVLKGHKSLKEIRAGFNTKKENVEGKILIEEILKL